MKKQIVIFAICIAVLCCTFIGCDPISSDKKSVNSQEIYNSITKEDMDKAIENPDEFTEEELKYYKSMLDWYEYSIGVSGEVSWNDPSEIVRNLVRFYEVSPNGFATFYDKVQKDNSIKVEALGNLMYVPADEVENFIMSKFNIEKDVLRNKAWWLDVYDPLHNAYPFNIEMGFGGLYGYQLLKVEKSGNVWKLYCSNSYLIDYGNEEVFEEDYVVIVIEHNGEDDYKYLCAKGFHEDIFEPARAKFEYPFSEGIRLCEDTDFCFDETVPQENRDREFASLLQYAARANINQYSDTSFLIGDQIKADAAISMLGITTYAEEYSRIWGTLEDRAELLHFANEDIFIPKEWVEKAIKQIWGNDVEISHQVSYSWEYKKDAGIYTPKGTEGTNIYPYIHSVTKTKSGYVAEVSYLYTGYPGVWGDVGGEGRSVDAKDYSDIFATPEVVELAKEQTIYNVTAEYGDDGKLHLKSSTRGWNQSRIKSDLTYAYEESLSTGEISLYVGKNTEIVVSTAAFLGVENYLGFESYAVENGSYELVNLGRIELFLRNCERGVADTLFTLKSGEPLPLYAVVLRYDGVSIKKDSYYLRDDELVNITSSQLVEVSESETMWFFSCDGEVVDIFPKTEIQPLPFAEEGSMTTDEIAKKLESMNKYGFKVKYQGEEVVLETQVYRFDYYDQGTLMDYIYISKDLQKIFVVEQVNGHVLTVVK